MKEMFNERKDKSFIRLDSKLKNGNYFQSIINIQYSAITGTRMFQDYYQTIKLSSINCALLSIYNTFEVIYTLYVYYTNVCRIDKVFEAS